MTHVHRRPHRYAPPRVTLLAALVAAGGVGLGVTIGLVVAADDAQAAPRVPAAVVCEQGASGGMRCTDREPLWPVGEDYQTYLETLAARTGATVGQAVGFDAVLVSAP